MKASMTICQGLPSELRKRTQFSVDASIYFTLTPGSSVDSVKIEQFNPNNPNICFRNEELQMLGETSYYLDVIWALDADSPEAAETYVSNHLPNVIPVPKELKLDRVEIGSDGISAVYDNKRQEWY